MATKRSTLEENNITPLATRHSVTAPQGGLVATPTPLPVDVPTSPQVDTPTVQKFSVHGIETRMIKRLKQAALDQDRTISEVVAAAFAEYLERHEVRHAPH